MRCLLAAGSLVGALAACSGEGDDGESAGGCPTGTPSVALTGFAVAPKDGRADMQDVDLAVEVANESSVGVLLHTIEVHFGSSWYDMTSTGDAPRVAATETKLVEGGFSVPGSADFLQPPDSDNIRVGWRWDSDEHRDCATPELAVDTTAVEGTVTPPTTVPPAEPPQAPPDALAIGETATFSLANGQEIRVTVTEVTTDGTCPEAGAPPAQVGYLFVGVRLEVGAGPEPWRIHSSELDVRPGVGTPGVNDTAESCIGPSNEVHNVQAGPGQAAEGVLVLDGAGPAITYTFSAAGQDDQTVSWAL
jgi:hypothetical protein